MTLVSTLIAPKSISRRALSALLYKVMTYADLTCLYGVSTKALNQAVRWNLIKPFSSNCMYQIIAEKKRDELGRNMFCHGQAIAGLIDVIRQPMQVPADFFYPIGFMTVIYKLQSK